MTVAQFLKFSPYICKDEFIQHIETIYGVPVSNNLTYRQFFQELLDKTKCNDTVKTAIKEFVDF